MIQVKDAWMNFIYNYLLIIFLINKNIGHIFKSLKQNDDFYHFSYFFNFFYLYILKLLNIGHCELSLNYVILVLRFSNLSLCTLKFSFQNVTYETNWGLWLIMFLFAVLVMETIWHLSWTSRRRWKGLMNWI